MTTTVPDVHALLELAGADLGRTPWLEVPQTMIDQFAEATHDAQWIHVDPARAADGPFGTTIAHGYLTLALIVPLWNQVLHVERRSMGVNYGLEKVRFPAPVPAGSSVRLHATLLEAVEVGRAVQITARATVECDATEKPACVAEVVYRFYP